jgi:hypothetical protein
MSFVVISEELLQKRQARSRAPRQRGRTPTVVDLDARFYKLSLDGKVQGVLGESGKQLKQFGWIHEMACPSENVKIDGGFNHTGRDTQVGPR